ncbi:MAG: hypothetical protein ABWX92_10895, partial [Mycetocola sp.]
RRLGTPDHNGCNNRGEQIAQFFVEAEDARTARFWRSTTSHEEPRSVLSARSEFEKCGQKTGKNAFHVV